MHNERYEPRKARQSSQTREFVTYLEYPDLLAVALFDPCRRLKPPEGYLRSGITAHILEGRCPLRCHAFLRVLHTFLSLIRGFRRVVRAHMKEW